MPGGPWRDGGSSSASHNIPVFMYLCQEKNRPELDRFLGVSGGGRESGGGVSCGDTEGGSLGGWVRAEGDGSCNGGRMDFQAGKWAACGKGMRERMAPVLTDREVLLGWRQGGLARASIAGTAQHVASGGSRRSLRGLRGVPGTGGRLVDQQ